MHDISEKTPRGSKEVTTLNKVASVDNPRDFNTSRVNSSAYSTYAIQQLSIIELQEALRAIDDQEVPSSSNKSYSQFEGGSLIARNSLIFESFFQPIFRIERISRLHDDDLSDEESYYANYEESANIVM